MKKQYAFLLMDPGLDPEKDQAKFETEKYVYYFCAVRGAKSAKAKTLELIAEGVEALEVCGAFGPDLARELAALGQGKLAVGYVTHDQDQDALFSKFFS